MQRDTYFYHSFYTGLNAVIVRNQDGRWTLQVENGTHTIIRKTTHTSQKSAYGAWNRMCLKRMQNVR